MRSTRLVAALTAAASLTLGPAAASAHRHAGRAGSPPGRCRLSLQAAPRVITAGESTLAFGALRCSDAAAQAGQQVTLYEGSLAGHGYSVAGTATTDEQGLYQLSVAGLTADSRLYALSGSARSRFAVVRVAVQVSLSGPPEGVMPTAVHHGHRRKTVLFTGSVTPAQPGARAVLQRQNPLRGSTWHRIDVGLVQANGSFSITHTFHGSGPANIRVLVRSPRRTARSASNVLSYEIPQAQDPQLTITSSADPISYGQSMTISGVLAGGSGAPVQLLAHPAHARGFAVIATTVTDASGAYSFPAQTPLASTLYRVRGGGRSSAALYEGVKYVLTAAVSGSTVQAGQPLTFSGTVAPALAGQPVYLERQNATGTSFHVIQATTVTGSSYTIAHTFFDAGTSVVRVRIPGDRLIAATDSQPFTIQVTPAPTSALRPERPGNSKLPGRGGS